MTGYLPEGTRACRSFRVVGGKVLRCIYPVWEEQQEDVLLDFHRQGLHSAEGLDDDGGEFALIWTEKEFF